MAPLNPVRRVALAAVAMLFLPGSSGAQAKTATEYEIKAAFLYNFARYVEWPSPAPPSPPSPPSQEAFVVTILGEDPFGEALEAIRDRTVRDRQLVVRRVARVEDVGPSQILFISRSEAEDLPRILQRLGPAPVLTVGESPQFAERGGMIRFRRDGDRIGFDINVDSAHRAGLRVSSQLLKLARIVGTRGGG